MLDSGTLYAEGLVLHSGFIQTRKTFEEINYLHGARLSQLSIDQLMLAHGQVLAGFETDCLHSSRLFSAQRANEEVTENVLVPIKLELDIVRQNRRSRRARDIIWIQYAQQALAAEGPQSNARRAVIDGQPAMNTKAPPNHIGTCSARRSFREARPCDRAVRDQQSKNR